jgi:TRAP-type C4-dicarboxylate transport system substrate-binding protein
MKKRNAIALAAVLALTPFAAGAQEAHELKLSMVSPPTSPTWTQGWQKWVERIEKDGEGTVKIKPYFSGQLANFNNVYDRLNSGVFELANGLQSFVGGQFPGTSVADLPFVAETGRDAAAALWALYEQGLLAKEYAKVHPLLLFVYPQVALHFKKSVTRLEDLEGMKVSVSGKVSSEIMQRLGTAPIAIGPQEVYETMNRGVVSGSAMQWTGMLQFKIYEVANYHLDAPLGSDAGFMFMSPAAYAKLPAKGKAAFDHASGYKVTRDYGASLDAIADFQYKSVEKMPNHHFAKLSPQETERWKKLVEPVVQGWVARTENGAAILAAYRAEVAKSVAAAK